MHSMPFEVSKQSRTSLTDQVTDGLRRAVITGQYKVGAKLPNLEEMAVALKVSEIVTRHAVQRLTREGLLNPRPRTGITVCSTKLKTWRGHVLYMSIAGARMYYQSMLSAALVDRLHAANVLVSTVELGVEPTMALAKARAALTHAVSLAVIDGNPSLLEPILAEREVAFIEFNQIESRCSRHAVQSVAVRRDAVLLALRDHCLACGVRRVLQVTDPKPSFDVGPTLRNAGLIVDDLLFNDLPGYGSPERVERGALEAVERWLATGPTLPDLIWFGDDFAARGALLAMASRGLRIPEDVQVISWANKGLGPVFSKPLTRVEMDPIAHGEALAQCVLDRLGGLHGKPVELVPAFIEGATTRKR